jgi:hypothetical protein
VLFGTTFLVVQHGGPIPFLGVRYLIATGEALGWRAMAGATLILAAVGLVEVVKENR